MTILQRWSTPLTQCNTWAHFSPQRHADFQYRFLACNLEPYDGDLNKYRGFLLQSHSVFSQRARLFASNSSKINLFIGLLCRPWHRLRPMLTAAPTVSLEEFLACFKCVFNPQIDWSSGTITYITCAQPCHRRIWRCPPFAHSQILSSAKCL